MRQCRIKKGEETRSFPSRNPFTLYSFLFYWLSERYRFLESFAGIVCCNQHLCPFLALTQRCSSQDCGIATLGKLHQLADKNLLFGCRWYVMQYLILLRSVNTDVLGCTKIANLRIKSNWRELMIWYWVDSDMPTRLRGTDKKRARCFLILDFATSQISLTSYTQRYWLSDEKRLKSKKKQRNRCSRQIIS